MLNVRSLDPLCLDDVRGVMDSYWQKQLYLATSKGTEKELGTFSEDQKGQIIQHLSHYILEFDEMFQKYSKFSILCAESLLVLRKWSEITLLCQDLPSSHLIGLKNSEFNNLFFGEGSLCAGSVMQYFSQFFKTHSPLDASPFPIASIDPLEVEEGGMMFYPFTLTDDFLETQTKGLRYLQAAYKAAYTFKTRDSLEFMPGSTLKNLELQLLNRIPNIEDSEEIAFKITDLVPKIKELLEKDEESDEKGYLLGIRGPINHSLALHLKEPFHFVDPTYGIGMASNVESLVLFLVSYLMEKYSQYSSFALLEIAPQHVNDEMATIED